METALTPAAGVAAKTSAAASDGRAADVSATAAGVSAEAFDEIVRQHQRRIYCILLAMLRDTDVADTLTQECFLRAYRNWGRFRGDASVGTWLARIAMNLARDHRRSRRAAFWSRLLRKSEDTDARSSAMARAADPQASPERALAAKQDAAAVWAAAETLPEKQRAVFVLRFAEGMSLEEIAGTAGIRVGTVKVHLHRALSAVRRQLKEQGRR